jgi:hypothetical protein
MEHRDISEANPEVHEALEKEMEREDKDGLEILSACTISSPVKTTMENR